MAPEKIGKGFFLAGRCELNDLVVLGGGFVLVLLHRLFGLAAYYSHSFGILVKGKPDVLVLNGRVQHKAMRWNHISEHDLQEDMRLEAKTEDLSKIKVARVERSGDISFMTG